MTRSSKAFSGWVAGAVFGGFGGMAGNREGAIAGWQIYLLGLAMHVVGLLVMGVPMRGTRLGWLALLIGILHGAWLPAVMREGGSLLIANQVGIGVAWMALGLLATRGNLTYRFASA